MTIGFGMGDPQKNEPRHKWYQKWKHVRIPKRAESKAYLDAEYTKTQEGGTPTAPVISSVTISGGTPVGSTLTAHVTATGNPTPTYTYQWKRNGANILGATGATYVSTVTDIGTNITVTVTATNGVGSPAVATSGTPIVVTAIPPTTFTVQLIGTGTVGSMMSASVSDMTGVPLPTQTHQWLKNAIPISGATSVNYTPVAGDVGGELSCRVTATNAGGSSTRDSSSITVVQAPVAPVLTATLAGTAAVGGVLTVTTNVTAGYPTPTLAYQFYADGTVIPDATSSSYTVTTNELGKNIKASVTASNSAGSTTVDTNVINIPVPYVSIVNSGSITNITGSQVNNPTCPLTGAAVGDLLIILQTRNSASPEPASPDSSLIGYIAALTTGVGNLYTEGVYVVALTAAQIAAGSYTITRIGDSTTIVWMIARNVGDIVPSFTPQSPSASATSGFNRTAALSANTIASYSSTFASTCKLLNIMLQGSGARTETIPAGTTLLVANADGRYEHNVAYQDLAAGIASTTANWSMTGSLNATMTAYNIGLIPGYPAPPVAESTITPISQPAGSNVVVDAHDYFVNEGAISYYVMTSTFAGASQAGNILTIPSPAVGSGTATIVGYNKFGAVTVTVPITITATPPLRVPGEVSFTGSTGTADGTIDVAVLLPLPNAGDSAAYGDGLATLVKTVYSLNGGAVADLDTTDPLNGTYTISGLESDTSYTVQVYAVNSVGAQGATSSTLTVTSGKPAIEAPVKVAELPSLQVRVGDTISVPLSTIFTGTSPTYTISPPQAKLQIVDGVLQNNGALDSVIADVVITVTATNGAGSANDTTTFGVSAVTLATLQPVVSKAFFRYTDWRTPVVNFPTGPDPSGAYRIEWTTSDLDPITGQPPAGQSESAVAYSAAEGGGYQIRMTDAAKNGVATPRTDYSIFADTGGDATRCTKLRFRHQMTSGGPWSVWSQAVTVPLVQSPTTLGSWVPWLMQWQAAAENKKAGSRGMQFQRGVCWNWGTQDPTKDLFAFTFQDYDQGWATEDGFRTMFIARGIGCYGGNEGGIYYNSDDNNLVVRLTCDPGSTGKLGGCYVSHDGGVSYKRYTPTRPVGPLPSFDSFMNGQNNRRNFNQIARRPQNAAGTLTYEQRPIYILEQVNDGVSDGGKVTNVILWKSTDNLATEPVYVRELTPLANFAHPSNGDGLRYIDVDTNGDILISGLYGAWLSTDGGASFTKKYTGEVTAQFIKNGAGILAVKASPFGIVKSPNVRTTAFTKPTGGNIPANYATIHMGVAYSNPNRIAICTAASNNPQLSEDGGVTWTKITSLKALGESSSSYRYTIQSGPSGFYFHPRNEMLCWAHTAQTATLSEDGGRTFDGNAVSFFDGSFVGGVGFDRTNPDRFVVVQTDSVCQYMANSPLWIDSMSIGLKSPTVDGGVLGDEITAASGGATAVGNIVGDAALFLPNNRVLLGLCTTNGAGGRDVPVVIDFAVKLPKVLPQGGVTTVATRNDYHPDNTDMLFMGRWRVTNLTAAATSLVFTNMGREFIGYSKAGGVFTTFWGGTGTASASVYRSQNADGSGATLWATLPASVNLRYIVPDPFVQNRVLFSYGDNPNIYEAIGPTGSVVIRSLGSNILQLIQNDLNRYPDTVANRPTKFPIGYMAADYNRSGLFYAYMYTKGCANIFQSLDGGVVWEDITANMVRGSTARLFISRQTGDLIVGTSNGTRVRQPSPGYPAIANAGKAYKTWAAYYNDPVVPNPPLTGAE